MCGSEEENLSTDVVTCALADASGTSYVRGRWISDSENSLEMHHRIVAPTLPGTGDYSAYSLWGKFFLHFFLNTWQEIKREFLFV